MATTTIPEEGASEDAPDIPVFHTVGIGAGPANLSLAALYQSATDSSIALFDKQSGPNWHDTLLQSGVRMQTSWLKDLVSIVDPTHKLSFMNYLVTSGRLFALLNAQFDFIPRREYMQYLAWAAGQIENIHYGVAIDRIALDDDGFVVYCGDRAVARSEHVVVGVGTRPAMPASLGELPGERAFLADDLRLRIGDLALEPDAPIAVVGGGQTGLECVIGLLQAGMTDIRWLGRRQWFQTIDDSPVANEFYRPAHQRFLQELPRETRRELVVEQHHTADALTPGGLRVLYQANYDRMLEIGRYPVALLPGRDVMSGAMEGDDVVLQCSTNQGVERQSVRHALVATGRETLPVPFDDALRARIETDEDGEMIVDRDYSVRWERRNGHRIYALNRGRMSHGIPDANLTLLPVRSAIVLNSMFGRELFAVRDDVCPISWS
ncbi:MAG TPA: SidA/IucD/PvdA family monooxygenase [Solirubrobacteraceae bacterium]|jgi:lysine N6-hydroxylase|nr:SidA/IucD/PvdA family monooxygenase [Solirubrobacteraceae bacterium]